MDKNIKVSIAIPCYNMYGKGAEFLRFNLNRVKEQTYTNLEVIISDHSTDDLVLDVVKSWESELNIKYVRNDYKRGSSSANINIGINHCTGDIIKILFQDDFLFSKDSLQKTVDAFDLERPWLVTTCCHTNNGDHFYRTHHPRWNENIHKGVNTISSPSVLTINGNEKLRFDEELIWLMDVDYYKKLYLKYGQPTILKELTVVNRMWSNQVSNVLSDEIKNAEVGTLIKRYETN